VKVPSNQSGCPSLPPLATVETMPPACRECEESYRLETESSRQTRRLESIQFANIDESRRALKLNWQVRLIDRPFVAFGEGAGNAD
jgi:hypothetical protein